jgi:serine/threonine protein phosphatase PrpC
MEIKHSFCSHSMTVQGNSKQNQDKVFVISSNNIFALVILDGHGDEGEEVADNTQIFFREWFETNSHLFNSYDNIERMILINNMFDGANNNARIKMQERKPNRYIDESGIVRMFGIPIRGGTTFTISFVFKKENEIIVHTSNSGDSPGFIVATHPDGKTEYTVSTTSHCPHNQAEFERLQTYICCNLLLHSINNMPANRWPPIYNIHSVTGEITRPETPGIYATNAKGTTSAYMVSPPHCPEKDNVVIAMTRSIGDFYAGPGGLTHTPSHSINSYPLDCKIVVIVESDGVSDCVPDDEKFAQHIMNNILSGKTVNEVVRTTINTYALEGLRMFGPRYRDDTSLACLFVEPVNT